jgi:outer membrane lipoprotein SlyB
MTVTASCDAFPYCVRDNNFLGGIHMKKQVIILAGIAGLTLGACATMNPYAAPAAPTFASAETLTAPEPIDGNSGKYMSPYTTDEVVAEWVDKAVNAKQGAAMGGAVGSAAAQYAGSQLSSQLGGYGSLFGSLIGKSVGEKMGRDAAIKAAGGTEFIRDTSDLSFGSIQDLALYMYVEHSHRENYADVLAATEEIYPELKTVYAPTIIRAGRS